jgi:hypothetical protein
MAAVRRMNGTSVIVTFSSSTAKLTMSRIRTARLSMAVLIVVSLSLSMLQMVIEGVRDWRAQLLRQLVRSPPDEMPTPFSGVGG